jgi:hypothetical protein
VTTEALYEAALCAAFWVALAGCRPRSAGDATRFVAGLALGAVLARAGGLLLAPAGLLLAAPWSGARRPFLDVALPALPLAFATAKLGCLAAGCCTAAALEAAGFAALGVALRGARPERAGVLALAGLGAVRLAVLPFRPEASASALAAGLWLALAALRCLPRRGGPRCPRPGSATSSRTARSSRPGCAASSPLRATSP